VCLEAFLACLAGALLVAGSAFGVDTGFYLGGSIGPSNEKYDASTFNTNVGNRSTGFQIGAGYRPVPGFAGELDEVRFGRVSAGLNRADTDAIMLSGLVFLPIHVVNLYGRLALMDWHTYGRCNCDPALLAPLPFHRTGASFAYGIGAGTDVYYSYSGNLGVRLEFEKFDVAHANKMTLASIGLTWSFL